MNDNEYKTCPDCCYDILDDEGDVMDHECISDNEMIAEFMGGQRVLPDEDVYNMPTHNNLCYGVNELQYDTSWDWLMPVVEKIECTHDDKGDCFNVMMEAFECTISGLGLTLCLNGHTKMDATYKAVVEFIKEHNEVDRLVYLSKYTCDSCGDRTDRVAFNEDKDINECMDCI